MMKTVLITGGSSGIGFALSKHFAKAGYRLLWVAKPPEELAEAKSSMEVFKPGVEIHTLALDLTADAAAMTVHNWAKDNNWLVDVLVNNAGIGTYGFLQNIDMGKEETMIRLNVLGVYRLTRLFLDDMLARDRGTIINISSNSSLLPIPRMNTYASTKAFVKHFSQGLQQELKIQKSKVRVMTVCPSAVQDTPFKVAANAEKVKTYTGLAFTTAQEVAKDIWKGYTNGKSLVITGFKMRMIYSIRWMLPGWVERYLAQRESEEG